MRPGLFQPVTPNTVLSIAVPAREQSIARIARPTGMTISARPGRTGMASPANSMVLPIIFRKLRPVSRPGGFEWADGRAAGAAAAKLLQNNLRRTKPGKGRLNKVQADKCRQQEPPFVDPMRQRQARKHERPGEDSDSVFQCHRFLSIRFISSSIQC